MDVVSIGAAVALAKKQILPQAAAGDAGEVMMVGADGKWTKGVVTGATIAVSDTTLVITPAEEGE